MVKCEACGKRPGKVLVSDGRRLCLICDAAAPQPLPPKLLTLLPFMCINGCRRQARLDGLCFKCAGLPRKQPDVSKDLPKVQTYTYLGDKLTRPDLKRAICRAVHNDRGKCIRGKNGNMLVELEDGKRVVVLGRMLRKVDENLKKLEK